MKPVLLTLLVILLATAAVFAIGSALPATREATATRSIQAPPELVRATILDVGSQPQWRGGVAGVEAAEAGDSWTEVTRSGERIRFRIASQAPDSIVLTFESAHGYSGRWEAVLSGTETMSEGATTTITVREQATTPAPIGRILARLLFDQQAFATTYLDELAAEVARRQTAGK